MKPTLLALSIALAYLPGAQAQSSDTGTKEVHTLETIVVSGTRTERRLQEVPGSISVVGEKQLESSQPQYLGDELATVPGIFLNREEQGSYNTIIIRGVPTRHHNDTFLMLLDCVPFAASWCSGQGAPAAVTACRSKPHSPSSASPSAGAPKLRCAQPSTADTSASSVGSRSGSTAAIASKLAWPLSSSEQSKTR